MHRFWCLQLLFYVSLQFLTSLKLGHCSKLNWPKRVSAVYWLFGILFYPCILGKDFYMICLLVCCRSEDLLRRQKSASERREKAQYGKVLCGKIIWLSKYSKYQAELAKAYPALFRLLWQSTLPCYPPPKSKPDSESVHMLRKCSWQVITCLPNQAHKYCITKWSWQVVSWCC